jgi:large subunit ribosomal protein L6
MKKDIIDTIELKDGATASVNGRIVTVKGKRGELSREVKSLTIVPSVQGSNIVLKAADGNKRDKRMIFAMSAHIRNMVIGVTEGHKVVLKVCASHFPMNITISGRDFTVKNFFGEKVPRSLKLKEGVEVKLDGQMINVEGPDIEKVGQTAASIEQLCRITNRDKRIFQDGIYIINKYGQEIQ